jgi:hypothetical protein
MLAFSSAVSGAPFCWNDGILTGEPFAWFPPPGRFGAGGPPAGGAECGPTGPPGAETPPPSCPIGPPGAGPLPGCAPGSDAEPVTFAAVGAGESDSAGGRTHPADIVAIAAAVTNTHHPGVIPDDDRVPSRRRLSAASRRSNPHRIALSYRAGETRVRHARRGTHEYSTTRVTGGAGPDPMFDCCRQRTPQWIICCCPCSETHRAPRRGPHLPAQSHPPRGSIRALRRNRLRIQPLRPALRQGWQRQWRQEPPSLHG